MREAQFLKENADKWKQYELEVDRTADPDVYAERFIEITDDFAFAKTFFPESKTTKYLNGLAGRFHQKIYKNKKERSSRLIDFWRYELPFIFFQYQRILLYAFLIFMVFTFVGVLSAKYDSSFLTLILGDDYVNMTRDNIANNNPFGVYKRSAQAPMFFAIAINNIQVSFFTFAAGIFYSIGTVVLIMRNAIMLGSFEYFFFSQGLGLKSILVVFLHGTLEISALVIAGCAGLILGNSLLFPKTFSRWDSLRKAGKDGIKIIIGLVPVFITAAFIESFITRYTEMPLWLSASILGLSLFFIIYYFIWYPQFLHRRIKAMNEPGRVAENNKLNLWLKLRSSSEN